MNYGTGRGLECLSAILRRRSSLSFHSSTADLPSPLKYSGVLRSNKRSLPSIGGFYRMLVVFKKEKTCWQMSIKTSEFPFRRDLDKTQ
eukprot:scaffold26686_cov164-Skeletonema_menzelii.AAC.3